jgi:hypothetical protein
VLATAFGPNATLFARSASVKSLYQHAAHAHRDGGGRCKLDETGWINFQIPVNVATSALIEENYSCEEPAETSLREELVRRFKL